MAEEGPQELTSVSHTSFSEPLAFMSTHRFNPHVHLPQLIKIDYPPSVPSPACAPSSLDCSLIHIGFAGSTGSPEYSVYSVVDESTVRISYSVAPSLINSFLTAGAPKKLAFYSSINDTIINGIYLGDITDDGKGFVDVFVSETEFIQFQAYDIQYGPSVSTAPPLPNLRMCHWPWTMGLYRLYIEAFLRLIP